MLPLMAALVLTTTAGAALAVDLTRAYSMRAHLQTAADSAALAAAIKLPDIKAARKAAKVYTAKNLPKYPDILRKEDFEFGHWNGSSRTIENEGDEATAVRLTLRLNEQRGNGLDTLFAGVFGEGVMNVEASAVAGKQNVACMIALDADKKGIEVKGKAQIDLVGCGAQSNSTSKEGLKIGDKKNNDIRIAASGICVSGRAKIEGNVDVTPTPTEYCPLHEDPLADFIPPEAGGCTDNALHYVSQTITLTPGRVFCGGLKLEGDTRLVLAPGLYIVDNGKLEVKDDAVLEGDGVTIMLLGEDAEFDIKDNAVLRLTAPTSGDLKGLLIVQAMNGASSRNDDDDDDDDEDDEEEASAASGKESKWDSKAASDLRGVVYLPYSKFTSKIEASITGTDACFVLIANQIKLDGESKLSIDLTGTGCRQSLPASFSRSVALLH